MIVVAIEAALYPIWVQVTRQSLTLSDHALCLNTFTARAEERELAKGRLDNLVALRADIRDLRRDMDEMKSMDFLMAWSGGDDPEVTSSDLPPAYRVVSFLLPPSSMIGVDVDVVEDYDEPPETNEELPVANSLEDPSLVKPTPILLEDTLGTDSPLEEISVVQRYP
ncbi:uncharacterized protein LOC129890550 [Solanum dulcamara]|uniref:uncharacterized protein LOC129890550 n=1 Tax=Solanum dulcamara TaxID=45834 RepID=UPI002486AFF1|nr:uncharacterized protein LOC129890550 [Solanum dulcamara]